MSEERGRCGAVWIAIIIALLAVPALPGHASAASTPINPCPLGSASSISASRMTFASAGSSLPRPLNPCPGFEWAKTYGTADVYDSAWSIDGTSDGGAVVLIFTEDALKWVNVVKLDGEGVVQWQKRYSPGVPSNIRGDIQETSDGGFAVVAGNAIYRLNATGEVLWQRTYAYVNSGSFSIAQTGDQGFVVSGMGSRAGSSGDLWVLRLSSGGEVVWQQTYGDSSNNFARGGVVPTSDGGFVAAGFTDFPSMGWVLKMDSSGHVEWQRSYKGITNVDSIQTTTDGGFVLTGTVSNRQGNVWAVVKLTTTGSISWQKTYAAVAGRLSIAQTADGGYISSGRTLGSNWDLALLRIGPSGNLLWQRSYGGASFEDTCNPRCVAEMLDGNFMVVGSTRSFGTGGPDSWTSNDAWVLRVFSDGTISSSCVPTFGTSLGSVKVQGGPVKVGSLSFSASTSTGTILYPTPSVIPGTLVSTTQCSA